MDENQPAVPRHLGIIPDGNRRWAKAKGLPTLEGHRQGVEAFKQICYAALDHGVEVVTYYAFSTENWHRTPAEVKYLMELFFAKVTSDIAEVHDLNVRFRFVGSRVGLGDRLLKALDNAEAVTAANTRGTLAICLNYGGEQELVDAAAQVLAAGVVPAALSIDMLAGALYAPELPPIDLVIRTSGEQRLSGFMLWRAAYAELYFTAKHWPDFTPDDLALALDDYAGRKRRFGK
jgi:undecaprenyl diphosphate synthase